MLSVQGQGAITERLRSFSMHDLSQIDCNDPSNQLYAGYSNPGRRAKASDADDDGGTLNIAFVLTKKSILHVVSAVLPLGCQACPFLDLGRAKFYV